MAHIGPTCGFEPVQHALPGPNADTAAKCGEVPAADHERANRERKFEGSGRSLMSLGEQRTGKRDLDGSSEWRREGTRLHCKSLRDARVWFLRQVLLVVSILFMSAGGIRAQCPATADDIAYAPDTTHRYSLSSDYEVGHFSNGFSEAYMPTYFRVTRVVGPGVTAEFDSDGAITGSSYDTYIQNGIVSPNACVALYSKLEIPANFFERFVPGTDPVPIAFDVRFSLNGVGITSISYHTMVGPTTGEIKQSWAGVVRVPTSLLHFARRLSDPANPTSTIPCPNTTPDTNDTTCPGINDIEAETITYFTFTSFGGFVTLPAGVNVVNGASRLTFQAMAPVVMIHGCCGETGSWFDNANMIGPTRRTPLTPFAQAFRDAKMPFDDSTVNLNAETSIQAGGEKLLKQVPLAASQFGANYANLVAHSKGGLNARYFMTHIPTNLNNSNLNNFGVYSLTTISTPHYGSVLADYVRDARLANILSTNSVIRAALIRIYAAFPDASVDDLTTSAVASYNQTETVLPLPTTLNVSGKTNNVSYQAVSADAMVPGYTSIGPEALTGTPGGNLIDASAVWSNIYNLLGTVKSTKVTWESGNGLIPSSVKVVTENSTNSFQVNDFAVTRTSANYKSSVQFNEISFRQGENHWSEANYSLGQVVVGAIQHAQPVQ